MLYFIQKMKKHLTLNIKKLIPVIFLIIFSTLSYPQSSHKSTPRNKENYNHLHQINETPHGVFRYGSVSGNESNAPSFREFSPNYFHIENSDSSLWNGRHWDKKSHPLKKIIDSVGCVLYIPNSC